MIQSLRELEIKDYILLSAGRSLERAFGNSVALWSGVLMFITADYITHNISTALIFSTL